MNFTSITKRVALLLFFGVSCASAQITRQVRAQAEPLQAEFTALIKSAPTKELSNDIEELFSPYFSGKLPSHFRSGLHAFVEHVEADSTVDNLFLEKLQNFANTVIEALDKEEGKGWKNWSLGKKIGVVGGGAVSVAALITMLVLYFRSRRGGGKVSPTPNPTPNPTLVPSHADDSDSESDREDEDENVDENKIATRLQSIVRMAQARERLRRARVAAGRKAERDAHDGIASSVSLAGSTLFGSDEDNEDLWMAPLAPDPSEIREGSRDDFNVGQRSRERVANPRAVREAGDVPNSVGVPNVAAWKRAWADEQRVLRQQEEELEQVRLQQLAEEEAQRAEMERQAREAVEESARLAERKGAATRIQSAARMRRAQRDFGVVRSGIVAAQARWRGRKLRADFAASRAVAEERERRAQEERREILRLVDEERVRRIAEYEQRQKQEAAARQFALDNPYQEDTETNTEPDAEADAGNGGVFSSVWDGLSSAVTSAGAVARHGASGLASSVQEAYAAGQARLAEEARLKALEDSAREEGAKKQQAVLGLQSRFRGHHARSFTNGVKGLVRAIQAAAAAEGKDWREGVTERLAGEVAPARQEALELAQSALLAKELKPALDGLAQLEAERAEFAELNSSWTDGLGVSREQRQARRAELDKIRFPSDAQLAAVREKAQAMRRGNEASDPVAIHALTAEARALRTDKYVTWTPEQVAQLDAALPSAVAGYRNNIAVKRDKNKATIDKLAGGIAALRELSGAAKNKGDAVPAPTMIFGRTVYDSEENKAARENAATVVGQANKIAGLAENKKRQLVSANKAMKDAWQEDAANTYMQTELAKIRGMRDIEVGRLPAMMTSWTAGHDVARMRGAGSGLAALMNVMGGGMIASHAAPLLAAVPKIGLTIDDGARALFELLSTLT